jgi:hypothetical protein
MAWNKTSLGDGDCAAGAAVTAVESSMAWNKTSLGDGDDGAEKAAVTASLTGMVAWTSLPLWCFCSMSPP